jgi:hypothetical protein
MGHAALLAEQFRRFGAVGPGSDGACRSRGSSGATAKRSPRPPDFRVTEPGHSRRSTAPRARSAASRRSRARWSIPATSSSTSRESHGRGDEPAFRPGRGTVGIACTMASQG